MTLLSQTIELSTQSKDCHRERVWSFARAVILWGIKDNLFLTRAESVICDEEVLDQTLVWFLDIQTSVKAQSCGAKRWKMEIVHVFSALNNNIKTASDEWKDIPFSLLAAPSFLFLQPPSQNIKNRQLRWPTGKLTRSSSSNIPVKKPSIGGKLTNLFVSFLLKSSSVASASWQSCCQRPPPVLLPVSATQMAWWTAGAGVFSPCLPFTSCLWGASPSC